MRFKGKISEWNDDRGFGFIAPSEGRPRATQIRYAGAAKPPPVASPPLQSSLTQAIVGSSVFLVVVVVLVVAGRAPWWVFPWYLVLSAVTFMLYGWDKVSARGGHWRTQESTLNGLALLGGWPGGWIAQYAWRHKSRKTSFQVEFWAATLVNVGVLVFFIVFGVEALL